MHHSRIDTFGDEDGAGATVGHDTRERQARHHPFDAGLAASDVADALHVVGSEQVAFGIELAFATHAALRNGQMSQPFAMYRLQRQAAVDVVAIAGKQGDGGEAEDDGKPRRQRAAAAASVAGLVCTLAAWPAAGVSVFRAELCIIRSPR